MCREVVEIAVIEFIPEIDIREDYYEVWITNLRYTDKKPRAKELIQFCRPSSTIVPYICAKNPEVWSTLLFHIRRMGFLKVRICYNGKNCKVVELCKL
jgi:hypothetical protein